MEELFISNTTLSLNDPNKFYKDRLFVSAIYEKYLVKLSKKLNEIHGLNYPDRYWRIIIGLWLLNFIEILYDRFCSLINAKNSFKIDSTVIYDCNYNQFIPKDMLEFHSFYLSDYWNQYIFSEIIEFFDFFKYEKIATSFKNSKNNNNYLSNIKYRIDSFIIKRK